MKKIMTTHKQCREYKFVAPLRLKIKNIYEEATDYNEKMF